MIRHESIITALIGAALGLPLGVLLAAIVTRFGWNRSLGRCCGSHTTKHILGFTDTLVSRSVEPQERHRYLEIIDRLTKEGLLAQARQPCADVKRLGR